jgi:hypothetical protein
VYYTSRVSVVLHFEKLYEKKVHESTSPQERDLG